MAEIRDFECRFAAVAKLAGSFQWRWKRIVSRFEGSMA